MNPAFQEVPKTSKRQLSRPWSRFPGAYCCMRQFVSAVRNCICWRSMMKKSCRSHGDQLLSTASGMFNGFDHRGVERSCLWTHIVQWSTFSGPSRLRIECIERSTVFGMSWWLWFHCFCVGQSLVTFPRRSYWTVARKWPPCGHHQPFVKYWRLAWCSETAE